MNNLNLINILIFDLPCLLKKIAPFSGGYCQYYSHSRSINSVARPCLLFWVRPVPGLPASVSVLFWTV